jgi:hypothetical protein
MTGISWPATLLSSSFSLSFVLNNSMLNRYYPAKGVKGRGWKCQGGKGTTGYEYPWYSRNAKEIERKQETGIGVTPVSINSFKMVSL